MSHCDDEVLSLLALGETVSAPEEEHLAHCLVCQSRLDQLTAVVGSARSITAADRPVAPPATVWLAIQDELKLTPSASVTPITSARSHLRRTFFLVAASAAAVGVLLGGVVTAGLLSDRTTTELVASADLGPIGESGLSGTAVVARDSAGTVLTVNVPGLPAVDGYYEVWMATADTATMVALGTLNPGQQGTFALPAGMDMAAFPIVDVSVEHFDGNPAHGVESVARGQLHT